MTLTWDLSASIVYDAGSELELTLSILAPEEATFYLLGALYAVDGTYIPGTLFGVASGVTYAVNSTTETSLWELLADEDLELGCRFVLDRSNVVLGLFLMKMAGDAPSLEDDAEVVSLSTALTSLAPEPEAGDLLMLALVVGMMGIAMSSILGGRK